LPDLTPSSFCRAFSENGSTDASFFIIPRFYRRAKSFFAKRRFFSFFLLDGGRNVSSSLGERAALVINKGQN
jgi:hypothetical protein